MSAEPPSIEKPSINEKPIIRIEHLSKSFAKQRVLADVSFNVPEKSIYAIVGQSGTGKSVLFKSIIGMIKPDSGKVWFKDTELTALDYDSLVDRRKSFGYAFQNAALFDSMNVGENLAFPLREVLGMKDKEEIRGKIKKLLEWIELPGIESKRTDELSGGMRKRVGVARALIMEPEVLFFDEPTTGLDPVLSETINNLVVRVNRELRITCLIITHDIPAAFRIAGRIAFLDQGFIIAEGKPEDVAKSEHPMVKDFIRIS
ncbi:MAG: ATP-binding cassette domain-containing protein, partial [Treponema sp.]|nr:ATP-binding cassette domain-containing protein [Treponema sp.]